MHLRRLQGLGKTRVTMFTHLLANLTNLLFNFLLIAGRLGFPRLEVNGAAIATVLGSLAGALLSSILPGTRTWDLLTG